MQKNYSLDQPTNISYLLAVFCTILRCLGRFLVEPGALIAYKAYIKQGTIQFVRVMMAIFTHKFHTCCFAHACASHILGER
jgi:hypothetical protein